MSSVNGMPTERVSCTSESSALGELLTGSASTYDGYILLELAPPWPADLWARAPLPRELPALLERGRARGDVVKALTFAPDAEWSRAGHTRVFWYRRPTEPCAALHKTEYVVPHALVDDLLAALFEQPAEQARFAAYQQATGHVRELMVCTQGSIDPCCGKWGYQIYEMLRAGPAAGQGPLRVWRTSMLGGHRFAPTMIDLPEGRYWGRLTAQTLNLVVERQGAVADIRPIYRGWGVLWSPFEQLVEAEAFIREGWAWTTYFKSGGLLDLDEARRWARVRIDFRAPDGRVAGAYEGTVERLDDVVNLHGCVMEREHHGQYRLVELTRLPLCADDPAATALAPVPVTCSKPAFVAQAIKQATHRVHRRAR
jgi:hypothetical protein